MTIELWMCLILALLAIPVAEHVVVHYLAFAAVNWVFLSFSSADASLLTMTFAALAIVDAVLIIGGAPVVLLATFATSTALTIESALNRDWLLNHVTSISIATNAMIIVYMVLEYHKWMRGRHGR